MCLVLFIFIHSNWKILFEFWILLYENSSVIKNKKANQYFSKDEKEKVGL